ncbi:MAG: helix-turn-helix transcriptional regulator [Pseudobdellovibrionaceae bacterium]|nr:helix-turn-helix transcriptional regulator [Bdellovibrionales bacterium]USN46495.1 MAG: helix-turn-helix transcriptional regulator [Pseudobdellovibrionaceae bacterium]
MTEKSRVTANSYTSDFSVIEPGLLFFEREHLRKKPSREIDVFANTWSLGIANVQPNALAVHRRGSIIRKSGWWATFIPPFSIIDWELEPGFLCWKGYLSTLPLPLDLPEQAIAFPLRGDTLPPSANSIYELVRHASEAFAINKEEQVSSVARKAKTMIDDTFSDHEVTVLDVANLLEVSHSFLARTFRRAFGLTPVSYRNKLRVFEAMRLLLESGSTVTEVSHEVGFGDMARFSKQFRSQMNAKPSAFSIDMAINGRSEDEKVS